MNHIKWLLLTIGLFENWPLIYIKKLLRSRSTTRLKLRNGIAFEVTHIDTTLPTIVEVFKTKVYGDLESLRGLTNPVIIDIGANIGSFTFYALATNPSARVFSFEPQKNNYESFKSNIEINHKEKNITPAQLAIAGSRGDRNLLLTNQQSGTNSFFPLRNTEGVEVVSCITLSDIFSNYSIEQSALLKIDCEGAEYEILKNAPKEVLYKIDSVILEWHAVPGETVEELETLLTSAGFKTRKDSQYPTLFAWR